MAVPDVLRDLTAPRHHGPVLRRSEPMLTRAELNGLILILMRIDMNIARIAAAEEGNGEEEE